MPALYPNQPYTAEDQLSDLVYGASDYQDPKKVMPTAGVAGGYSSMAPAPAPAAEPVAQYPPSSPPPAGANYVAEPQAAGPDPFAQPAYGEPGTISTAGADQPQSGWAPPTATASRNYNPEPLNATHDPGHIWSGEPEWDEIIIPGNVGGHRAQPLPWDSAAAPLEQPAVGPYTGPNYLSEPSGDLATMPGYRGYGGSGIDQFQQRVNGRQVEPAYPPTEPTVTQLPGTGDGSRLLPTPTPTPPTLGMRADVVTQTGGDTQAFLRDMYGPNPTQGTPSTLGTAHPDPFLDYRRSTSDIMTLPGQSPASAQTEDVGWPTLDFLTPLGTWATERGEGASRAGYNGPAAQNQQQQADRLGPETARILDQIGSGPFVTRRSIPLKGSTGSPQSGGDVGGTSAGSQPAAPKELPPAMFVMDATGNLTSDTNAQGSSMAYIGEGGMEGAPRPLMVMGIDENGQVSFDAATIPESSYAAATQRGERAAALSDAEFDAILGAGLMRNPDGSPLTPEQVAVWRQNMVGVPMLASPSWAPYIAPADGAPAPEAPVTFTAAEQPAVAAANTSSNSGSNWSGGNTYSSNRGGGGSSRGGGYSRHGSSGGGGSWYDEGGSYPPTMPEGMADFFGPDAFDSPIFDRMRGRMGRMGSRRRGRRRRGMTMPGIPGMPGREMPSRDVNLRVAGPVVNDALARALALRDNR